MKPALIPHSVEGYQVTTNTNRCLQCHGVESYRTTGAPRISPTHFMDSDGKVGAEVKLHVVTSVCNVTCRRLIPRQSWGIPLPRQKVTGNKRLLWEILTVSLV